MDRISFFLYLFPPYLFIFSFCLQFFLSFFLIYFLLSFCIYVFLSIRRSFRKRSLYHCCTLLLPQTSVHNRMKYNMPIPVVGHLVVSSHCIYQNIHFIVMQFKSVTSVKRRSVSSFLQPLYFLSCFFAV
jgi:hypothetical protein